MKNIVLLLFSLFIFPLHLCAMDSLKPTKARSVSDPVEAVVSPNGEPRPLSAPLFSRSKSNINSYEMVSQLAQSDDFKDNEFLMLVVPELYFDCDLLMQAKKKWITTFASTSA